MKTLIGVGECMVEMSATGKEGLMRTSFAGDVLNTLWYAQAPGLVRAEFFSAVGTDQVSQSMRRFLEDADVGTDAVQSIEGRRPGLYMIHLDGAERSFSYWRDTSAAKLLARDRAHLERWLLSGDALYFSGITLAILSAPDRAQFLDVLKQARDAGSFVAFDPNIRPNLWPDRDEMRDSVTAAAACATITLPSFDDEDANFGDENPQATGARYLRAGTETVVVKNGSGDIWVATGDGLQVYATAPVGRAVDTTGAGDSFNGAFLASYLQHGDIVQAIRAGQARAAEVICHHGALMPKARLS